MTRAILRITADDGSERTQELKEGTLRIGRGTENDIVLPDARKAVSREHAELRLKHGRCVVTDLGSQNGLWVGGVRVASVELQAGVEVSVGPYRLRLMREALAADAGAARPIAPPLPATPRETALDDVVIRPEPWQPQTALPPRPIAAARPTARTAVIVAASIGALALVGLILRPVLQPRAGETAAAAAVPLPAQPDPPGTLPPLAAGAAETPAPVPVESAGLDLPDASDRALLGAADASATTVARRPGETAAGWRVRVDALRTRYAYSRAALDRRDYAAAAGGFEAILRDEPGFLDAPELLVRARAGLREAATELFEAGNRLDAAEDWVGALQKYEQARQIEPDTSGLTAAAARVTAKVRAAGLDALARAREHDAAGRMTDALREYQKAAQWLPATDPAQSASRRRADELARSTRR